MNRVRDRKKLRRNYLRQKTKQIIYTSTGIVALLGAFWLLQFIGHGILDRFRASPEPEMAWRTLGLIAGVLAIYAFLANRACKLMESARNMNVPYVAPVLPETFPAEEVLVRGAERPVAVQSTMLLRAAQSNDAIMDDLLRICAADELVNGEDRQSSRATLCASDNPGECVVEYAPQAPWEVTENSANRFIETSIDDDFVSAANRYQGQCAVEVPVTVNVQGHSAI